jgi:hypothetical protein
MKPVDMFRSTETVVAGDEIEFNRKCGIAREKFLDKLLASARQNDRILEIMENRRLHMPESIEAGLPIRFAFFDPFP